MDRPKWPRPADIPAYHSDTHAYRIYGKRRLEQLRLKLATAHPTTSFQFDRSLLSIVDRELGALGYIHYGDWLGDEFRWKIKTVEGPDNDDLQRRTRGALDDVPRTRVDMQQLSGWCPPEVWIRYTIAEGGETHLIATIGGFKNRCAAGSKT